MENGRTGADRSGTAGGAPRRVPLESVVQALPDLVWLKDPDGVYVSCNARFEEFVGQPESSILGRTDFDLFPRELAEFFRAKDRVAIAAGRPTENEEEVTFGSDGHREVLETVKTPIFDADGAFLGVLGTARNITRRKAAEGLLALQSRILGLIAVGAPLATTLDAVTQGVEAELPGSLASILLLDEAGRTLRVASAPSLPPGWIAAIDGLAVAEGAGGCGTAAFRRAPIVVEDVSVDPLWASFRELAEANGIRATWSAPIFSTDRSVLGTFALYRREPARPTPKELRLMVLAADAAAVAVTRNREERALRESEARYRLVSENGSDVIWLYDLAANHFAWVSPSVERLRGFTVDEVLGQSLAEALTPESFREVEELLPRALADFASRGEAARSRTLEVWQARKDGTVVPTEVVATLVTDAAGTVTHIQGVTRDLSERKRNEAALREQDALLREMSATAHIGGWAFDPATGKGTWTDEVARIHDVDPKLPPTASFGLDFFHGRDRERIENALSEAMASGTPYDLELELVTATGTRKRVRTVGLPVVHDGRVVEMRGTIQDVSERAMVEEARERLQDHLLQSQKMESVGRLAGGIAHDFNNMLSVIDGHAALAFERLDSSSPVRADLVQIRKAAARSAALTRQLLAFARRQPAAPRPLDLNETVSRMGGMLGRLIGEDVHFAFDPAAGLWPVRIDPAQVDQLLANLCVNARDAIAGVGHVRVETRNVSVGDARGSAQSDVVAGDYVMLSVSDDGFGIPDEVRAHLFEPFFTTKDLGRGTGLGLATVWGIVRQNGGFVDVESTPGQGSSFRVHLPRYDGPVPGPSPDPEVATPLGAGETVLVVEDEGAMLRLCASMLRQLGYSVLPAASTAIALELAAKHVGKIDLLLTDVVMPEMNGRELAERIRAIDPGLPCLFMSGYTADVITHRGLLEDGVRFLAKPFSQHDLGVSIHEAVAESRARRAAAPEGAQVTLQDSRFRRLRLLLVDDEEALVELMRRALDRLGHDVLAFTDPVEAMAAFRAAPQSFDAVVTDVAMPGTSGLELSRQVLDARPDAVVVVTSGFVAERDEETARAAGARAILLKPSSVEEYGRALDELLRSLVALPADA